jgi:hypothetical protein
MFGTRTITGNGLYMASTISSSLGVLAASATMTAEGWREAGGPGGAQRLASTDGGAQRQDPAVRTGSWTKL